jgi:hypothetical protein
MSLRTKRERWFAPAVFAATLLCLWLAAQAQASPRVYWSTFGDTTIGSANPDGSEVDPSLISEASNPVGVAVDAVHIYWANPFIDTIGRANLDGSGVEKEFITGVNPFALAVAEGHIYWTNADANTIGRANLDGSGVEEGFVGNVGSFYGLAADSEHLYWGDEPGESIGRANLDGSGVDTEFIEPASGLTPYGVAVDAGHVYWSNAQGDRIGRAALDGAGIEEAFIANAHPAGLAVDDSYVYWGYAAFSQAIGRANLDGTGVDTSFVPGVESAFGLATTVAKATLATTASPDLPLGTGAIRGTAILRGANAPTGTITFRLYGPNDDACAGSPLQTGAVAVAGNGSYRSAEFTPTATGTYRWQASYSGDAENEPVDGACGQPVRVTDPPPASSSNCALVTASAGTFTPAPRPGKLVPGVRAMITVGAPSQLNVDASLTYRLKEKTRSVPLGSHSLHASPTGKLRLPLPASMRSAPAPGTKVRVTLRISATPDDLPGCSPPTVSLRSFKAKVVRVLGSA